MIRGLAASRGREKRLSPSARHSHGAWTTVQHNAGPQASTGSTVTTWFDHLSPSFSGPDANVVAAADVSLAFFNNFEPVGPYARSRTPGTTADEESYRGRLYFVSGCDPAKTFSATTGGFYAGDQHALSYNRRVEFTNQLAIEPRVSVNWLDLPQGGSAVQLHHQRRWSRRPLPLVTPSSAPAATPAGSAGHRRLLRDTATRGAGPSIRCCRGSAARVEACTFWINNPPHPPTTECVRP